MAEFNINNLAGGNTTTQTGTTNFDSLLNLARGQIENITKQLQTLVGQTTFNANSSLLDAGGVKVQLPQLSNLISGQQDILLKTALPIDRSQNFNVQVQNTNVVLNQGRPILQLQGQVIQATAGQPQRFTAEIPLQSLANQGANPQAGANNLSNQNTDQVVRNFLPQSNTNALTNNLNETIRPLLPQTLQNVNLAAQNDLNIQINSFTTPTGQQIIVSQNPNVPLTQNPQQTQPQVPNQPNQTTPQTQNTTPQNSNQQAGNTNINNPAATQNFTQNTAQNQLIPQTIQGQVEIFPDANEALIRTSFGTFRVPNLTQLPNGSQVNFTIQGQALPTAQTAANNILSLNPTNIQALRLSLEATDSPLQNLIKTLNSTQGLGALAQQLFAHPQDKAAYAKQLLFMSGSAKGSPEGWLGGDGNQMVNKLAESDTNLNRLQDVFSTLQNFTGKGQNPVSTEWNSYIIPFYDGSKLSMVTVQVQRDPEGSNQQTTKGKRKFILELEQDDLGRVAIEGLYSKVEGKVNNLDIILKTEKDVPEEFVNELNAIFNDTATAYGFSGSINFAPFTTPTPLYTDVSKILGDGIII